MPRRILAFIDVRVGAADGTSPAVIAGGGRGRARVAYLSAEGYAIRALELPVGLDGDELASAARSRERTLFPSSEGGSIVALRMGASTLCAAVKVEKALYRSCLTACPHTRVIGAPSLAHRPGWVVVAAPEWIDVLSFGDGRLRARTIERSDTIERVVAHAMEGMADLPKSVSVYASPEDFKALRTSFSSLGFEDIRIDGLEAMVRDSRSSSILQLRGPSRGMKSTVAIASIAAIALALNASIWILEGAWKARLERAQSMRKSLTALIGKAASQTREKAESTSKASGGSPYEVLSAIAASGAHFAIDRVTIEDGKFQLECSAKESYAVLRSLEMGGSFSGLSLREVLPSSEGEFFTLAGEYHDP